MSICIFLAIVIIWIGKNPNMIFFVYKYIYLTCFLLNFKNRADGPKLAGGPDRIKFFEPLYISPDKINITNSHY